MTFKIGDIVYPKEVISISNKQNMCEWHDGTIIDITWCNAYYLITVRRNIDGEIFKAPDYLWNNAH